MTHPIHRRIWAEELVRRPRTDEWLRYAASQRRGRIDANPHQIDAVLFALRKIRDGGCILADEVGLGKTIEAGLVVAQLLAEGSRRILFILPKALLGQWKSELYNLFGLDSREGGPDPARFHGEGIFVVGREFAGSERGASLLKSVEPFDLCVIDEAHEIFAAIYKRFSRDGVYDPDSTEARMAQRVRGAIGRTPVLLLTATPIQNNLTELWGLVQYVEPTGTLLGSIAAFRDLFCEPGASDRLLVAGQADELRRRINTVCQRTLRRQAQEFLERKFTVRRARLLEYEMSAAERSLHDDVTDYLLEPDLNAFRGSQRRLLLISFLRQMASSWKALAASLENVARRLRAILEGDGAGEAQATQNVATDLEEDDDAEEDEKTASPPVARSMVEAELSRVMTYPNFRSWKKSRSFSGPFRDASR
jgi:SNF2 family DNA or RNA helicase